jgi:hypothetical protein
MSIKQEGIQHFFELTNGLQTKPANYYVRWATNIETAIAANAALSDLTELSGNGYSPQAVPSNSTGMISAAGGTNGRTLTTDTVTFTASGGDWLPAKTMYLATTSDNTGKLIETQALNSGSGVTLLDGKSYDCAMELASEP